jgi:hypothetical protein
LQVDERIEALIGRARRVALEGGRAVVSVPAIDPAVAAGGVSAAAGWKLILTTGWPAETGARMTIGA